MGARTVRRALLGLTVAGLAAGGTLAVAGPASARPSAASPEATLGGTAMLTAPSTGVALASGGSATPFTVTLPAGAACSADTRKGGEHVFSFLVPAGTAATSLTFATGVPSSGYGLYTATGSYLGALATAPTTAQIVGIPLDLDWASALTGGNLTVKDLVPSGGSASWDEGIACASSSGAVTDDWVVPVTFAASSTDADGLTWSVGGTAPASAPAVSAIGPVTGPTRGGVKVYISGSGFTGATAVRFGTATASSVTVVSSAAIIATAPAHAPGAVVVTVTSPAGTSSPAAKGIFVYVAPPAVSRISPNRGNVRGGTRVTVHGSGFSGATRVTFGSSAGRSLHVVSASELTVVTPRHAKGAAAITVTGPYGTSGRSTRFTYTG